MSHPTPAPKHRAATPHRAPQVARAAVLRTSLALSSMAVVATGVAVGVGSLSLPAVTSASADDTHPLGRTPTSAAATPSPSVMPSASSAAQSVESSGQSSQSAQTSDERVAAQEAADAASERSSTVTRSDTRTSTDAAKAESLSLGQGNTLARSESLSDQSPQVIAQALLSDYGWSADQFGCLDSLWTRESGWNVHADNPSSSAYGIPQALPGSKMSSAGSDWENNPVTQIKWGLGYIAERYGSPCGAWGHSQATGFY